MMVMAAHSERESTAPKAWASREADSDDAAENAAPPQDQIRRSLSIYESNEDSACSLSSCIWSGSEMDRRQFIEMLGSLGAATLLMPQRATTTSLDPGDFNRFCSQERDGRVVLRLDGTRLILELYAPNIIGRRRNLCLAASGDDHSKTSAKAKTPVSQQVIRALFESSGADGVRQYPYHDGYQRRSDFAANAGLVHEAAITLGRRHVFSECVHLSLGRHLSAPQRPWKGCPTYSRPVQPFLPAEGVPRTERLEPDGLTAL